MEAKLTIRQKKAIAALTTTADVTGAAEAAGISRDTIYRWLKIPEFQAALDEATSKALVELSRQLVTLGAAAVQTIDGLLDETNAPPGTRLRAADIVLGRLLQVRELVALESRVAELERKYQERGNK